MEKAKLNVFIKKLAYSGKDYDKMKAKLLKLELEEETLRLAMREADQLILHFKLAQQQREKYRNEMLMRGLLFFLGSFITLVTYFSNNSSYLLAYGAILMQDETAVIFFTEYRQLYSGRGK